MGIIKGSYIGEIRIQLYGIGMLAQLNEELYAEGLTTIDRRTIGDGESTQHTRNQWAFKPIRC